MKTTRGLFSAALLLAASAAHAGDVEKALIRDLGRELGYGAAIHDFKNLVLRGTPAYATGAEEHFARATADIAALRNQGKLSDAEKDGLVALELVIGSYQRALPAVSQRAAAGKSPEDIDQMVKIADAPATWGLEVLRKGQSWSPFETLEAQLGFGGAIHLFKNYVLRAGVGTRDIGGNADGYRASAETQFAAIEKTLTSLGAEKGLPEADLAALKAIGATVKQYRANLAKVKDLSGKKKTVKEIDAAVKVDDAPALAGLALWRKKTASVLEPAAGR